MKGNQKEVFSQRIDIDIIGGMARSAQKRGETVAHITEMALARYLSSDVELLAIERANFQKACIESALDALGSSFEIVLKGDLVSKTCTICAICAGFDVLFPLRDSTKKAKLSLFEILVDIKDYDKGLFGELLPRIKHFKRLYMMFSQTTLV